MIRLSPALAAAASILVTAPALAGTNQTDVVRRQVEVRRVVVAQPAAGEPGKGVGGIVIKNVRDAGQAPSLTIQVVGAESAPIEIGAMVAGDTRVVDFGNGESIELRRTDAGLEIMTGSKDIVVPMVDGFLVLDRDQEDFGFQEVSTYDRAKELMTHGAVPVELAERVASELLSGSTIDGGTLTVPSDLLEALFFDREGLHPFLDRPEVTWTRDFEGLAAFKDVDLAVRTQAIAMLDKVFGITRHKAVQTRSGELRAVAP